MYFNLTLTLYFMQNTIRLINYLSKYDISINFNSFSTISPNLKHIFFTIPTAGVKKSVFHFHFFNH